MNEELEIEPCPFCGGAGAIIHLQGAKTGPHYVCIRCVVCKAAGTTDTLIIEPGTFINDVIQSKDGKKLVNSIIKHWNRRPIPKEEEADLCL